MRPKLSTKIKVCFTPSRGVTDILIIQKQSPTLSLYTSQCWSWLTNPPEILNRYCKLHLNDLFLQTADG